jgi:hypothetical protein
LALDDGDWICLQCGTYYYTGLYQSPPASVPPLESDLYIQDAESQNPEMNGPTEKSVARREYPPSKNLASKNMASKYLAANPADLL